MPRKSRSFALDLKVVGMQFRWKAEGRQTLARSVPIPVKFVREPDNPADENAIQVVIDADFKLKTLKGRMLGYLRRDTAAIIAPKLDAGKIEIVKLWVTDIYPEKGEADLSFRWRDVPLTKGRKLKT